MPAVKELLLFFIQNITELKQLLPAEGTTCSVMSFPANITFAFFFNMLLVTVYICLSIYSKLSLKCMNCLPMFNQPFVTSTFLLHNKN